MIQKNKFNLPSLLQQTRLLWSLVKRDVIGRYSGSQLGVLWALVTPLALLAVYTWVFSDVFKARWASNEESKLDFALNVYCGMLAHSLFSEVLGRSVSAVVGSPNYVKKVVFPLKLLPLIGVGGSLFHALCGLGILLIAIAFWGSGLGWTALYLPLVWLPLLVWCVAFAFFFASLAVYFRDVAQTTTFISTLLLFMSPVFYPAKSISPNLSFLVVFNPLVQIIENTRSVLLLGVAPNFENLFLSIVASGVAMVLALALFHKLEDGFADVI
jgi:lipopolysaccharide transport system permease protein